MSTSATTRRLLKETKELSAASPNPTPAFHAAPLSDTDLHEWHFTLLGPPSPSPYAGGLYHGRISLPPQYPYKPPNFRILTPSGRFETNREICLSISGFHEETWQPAWGVRTALTALRSFMAEKGTAGQVGGLESSEEVRRRLARESRGWRCRECGVSNEERMREWWEVCRRKGVGVDGDGVEVSLDVLPQGVELKTVEREVKTEGAPKAEPAHEKTSVSPQAEAQTQQAPPSEPVPTDTTEAVTAEGQMSASEPQSQTQPQPQPQTRSQTQSQTRPQPQPQVHPQRLQPIPQLPILSAQQQRARPTTPATDGPITIDRAIGVVFLALCLMILKKVFYPSSSSLLNYDDLRMVRE